MEQVMIRFFEAFSWMPVAMAPVVVSVVCMGWCLLHIYATSKAIAKAEKTTNASSGHKANITKSPKGSMCRKLIKKTSRTDSTRSHSRIKTN